jgi:hypothetical protein
MNPQDQSQIDSPASGQGVGSAGACQGPRQPAPDHDHPAGGGAGPERAAGVNGERVKAMGPRGRRGLEGPRQHQAKLGDGLVTGTAAGGRAGGSR